MVVFVFVFVFSRENTIQVPTKMSDCEQKLRRTHRSIQLAHSVAAALFAVSVVGAILFGWRQIAAVMTAAAVWLARMGGQWFHGLLPAVLRVGEAPTPQQLQAAAPLAFSLAGMKNLSATVGALWRVSLESLAFTCTYVIQDISPIVRISCRLELVVTRSSRLRFSEQAQSGRDP
jgi:hypothetical protein